MLVQVLEDALGILTNTFHKLVILNSLSPNPVGNNQSVLNRVFFISELELIKERGITGSD